jgi:hypothetical protein
MQHPERKGDELILKSVKKARAAIRDEQMAGKYITGPWDMDPSIKEPKYAEGVERTFKSPVFLVDPMFTKPQKDEEIQVFRDNDHAGFKQPKVQSKFPIVRKEIQDFFIVDEACTCRGKKTIVDEGIHYFPLRVPEFYGRVLEPMYKDANATRPAPLNQHTCYRGDDFGGHNIPYPHPKPPVSASYYTDCFVDPHSHR